MDDKDDNLVDQYRVEIDMFFKGTLPKVNYTDKQGKVRIVNHGNIEALQVEPVEGGQYELAVRVPFPPGHSVNDQDNFRDKYHGYIAGYGYIWGRNTGGH